MPGSGERVGPEPVLEARGRFCGIHCALIRPISLIGPIGLISPIKIRGECLVDHTGIVLFLHGTPGNPDIGAVQQDSLFAGNIGSRCRHSPFTG